MAKLLSVQELGVLFMPPGYLSGGELEAAFLLLRVDKLTGILSIFRVYMVQNTPKSAGEWVFCSLPMDCWLVGLF